MSNVKPLGNNVLVKALSEEEVSKSGIILPDTIDKEKPERGEVVAVGEGKLSNSGSRIPMTVKTGDKVVFKKYSPDEIKVDSDEFLIISEDDILAIIN